jgi:hypothetical protein
MVRVSGDISVATTCPTAVTQATRTIAVGFLSVTDYDPPRLLPSFFLIRNQLFNIICLFILPPHLLNRFFARLKTGGART